MDNAGKHIAPWSVTDVQRYLDGELSARERHDLEKQALDDPFLADALEGLQTQPAETRHQDLSGLRTRLDTRVTAKGATAKRPTIMRPFVRVAAAVILLVGLGFTAFYTLLDQKHSAPPVAASQPSPAAAPPAEPAPAMADSAPAPATSQASPVAAAPAPAAPPSLAATRIATKRSTRRPAGNIPDPLESRIFKDSIIHTDTPDQLVYSGRVLDLNHRPLAGAYLQYKSNTAGTIADAVTDQKGQFNLYVPQKDTARQLTVAMEGYEKTQYALNTEDKTGNTIFLRERPAGLEQVVVSGVGSKRKEYMAEAPSDLPETLDSLWLHVAPAMGRSAYLNYLETTRKTLPVDTAIHGIESISFRVDRKGALTEFRIERSLSPAHDAGVIRLITEGPPWKMLHGRSARALVNVTFP